ncbi:MAG: threonine synthase [Robiginitomaculum sp.]|nr:MAG: threonine synthase [Robiginitomaculum sp.]
MKFVSTRGSAPKIPASAAISAGIAPDGGLYVPKTFPQFVVDDFDGLSSLAQFANRLFIPFFEGDKLAGSLAQICDSSLDFAVPVQSVTHDLDVLELFHGPTAAFKDFGARFLAQCIDHMASEKQQTILVATSGDTGGAVGCAFEKSKHARVVILYPKGRVSPFQQHQLTCWGNNVKALEIHGDFDDCQILVKQAFADEDLTCQHHLGSANSINVARLLPQMSYYAFTAIRHFKKTGQLANYVIPTGNMGNGMACLWARACGLPIGRVVFAINANRTLFDFFVTGKLTPQPSVSTLANAMDVGNPSNFERYANLNPLTAENTQCLMISDQQIKHRISDDFVSYDQTWCPHTACAAESWRQLSADDRRKHWYLVATAHPYKFREVVEPLIGETIAPPPAMQSILDRTTHKTTIRANLGALIAQL